VQKLFARPVVAPFLIAFGLTLTSIGYGYLYAGSFQYISSTGSTQIISPGTNPATYWGTSVGMLVVGILMLFLSAYAVVCFSRAYRAGEVTLSRRPNPVGMVMIGIAFVLILLALAAKQCSHH
jgi:hypothetical protein